MKANFTDNELSMVCEVIASRMGLHFPVERRPMLSRNLVSVAGEFGYNNIKEFIQWLLSTTLNDEQLEILAAHLTITETYFWREPRVFAALTDFILPELIKSKKREKNIRIWSAGCSTGEEPYSIAIALHKTIPKIKDWNITILATDINAKALVKAETGIYNQWSFRNSPSWLKSTYFHCKQDRKFEIIPEIRKMVTFSGCSLAEKNYLPASGSTDSMDIIFCRNVLMYFTYEWADKISQNLFHSLSEEGWLIVSSCELSPQLFQKLTPVNFPGAILYRKTGKEPAHSFSVHSIETPEPLSDIAFLTTKASAKMVTKVVTKEEHQSPQNTPEESYADRIIEIRSLAGKGHLAEALSACNEAITSYKLAPGLYFLRASILQEMDKGGEAIKSLKQAIYIDPEYMMGHFTLGNLFFRQGNIKNAKRYFNNALDLLNTGTNDDIIPESEGLSVKHIRDIIITSLQAQESI
jgi:chemotaxis protein methyltransferase CheR